MPRWQREVAQAPSCGQARLAIKQRDNALTGASSWARPPIIWEDSAARACRFVSILDPRSHSLWQPLSRCSVSGVRLSTSLRTLPSRRLRQATATAASNSNSHRSNLLFSHKT